MFCRNPAEHTKLQMHGLADQVVPIFFMLGFKGCGTSSGLYLFVSELRYLLWALKSYVSAQGPSRGVRLLGAHPPHDAHHQALQQSVTRYGGIHTPAELIVGGPATNHTHPETNTYTTVEDTTGRGYLKIRLS